MPTTPNGTAWSITTATIPTGGVVNLGVPDGVSGDADLPLILYMHGAGGEPNQFLTTSTWTGLRNRVMDEGFCVVEGSGGGLQPWGNTASQNAYNATMAWADTQEDFSQVIVLARSMGGAVGARLYNINRLTDSRYVGLIENSGVQDLLWAYDWDGGRWTAAFNTAWAVTSKAELATKLAASGGLNPIDGPSSKWTGSRVIQMVGSADVTVPPTYNATPMRAMYAGAPVVGFDRQYIRPGGDHSAGNGSSNDVQPMMDFIYDVTGRTPPTPTDVTVLDIIARYAILSDGVHVIRSAIVS